jgi:hypothetical protein
VAYTDTESTALASITVVTLPSPGTLQLSGAPVTAGQVIPSANLANLTYVPAAHENGAKTFTVTASDGALFSPVSTVTLNLAPVDDAPVANAQSVSVTEDTAQAITLIGIDPDGSALTYTIALPPTKGVLSGTAPNLTYTPNANANGTDSFRFNVSDGTVTSAVATVSISIVAVNDAPSLAAISVNGTEDTTLAFTAANFTEVYSDPESTALASITVVTPPTTGVLNVSGIPVTAGQVIPSANLANLTYVPAADENGPKSFKVTASDGVLPWSPCRWPR